ncbi:alpha/beta hydrolase family esterase [Ancylobacter terrae]|uniref:alpha/beta hydrolase family esterase n=1 Tax=Ancylobacter sp. sgz301288 TaxID=3342077 RepID=UPI00385EA802
MNGSGPRTFLCLLLALLALAGTVSLAGAQERTLSVGGLKRDYILHTPANGSTGPWPLVIALHGAWQPASVLRSYLDLDAIADREGFAVAYPKGINLLWNDGRGSVAGIMPIIQKRDDAAFVFAVLDQLVGEGVADPGRAYLMGFSNGAFLTAFVACRYPGRFKAYATMMMTAPQRYAETCKPGQPIPMLIMNGTYDPVVPMFGRPTPGAELMSAEDSAAFFARLNGCGASTTATAPHTKIWRWENCARGSAVLYYEVEGGHQPPAKTTGAMDALASLVLGPRRGGLDAPDEIWTFFKRYGTPGTAPAGGPGRIAAGTPAATGPAALAAPGAVPPVLAVPGPAAEPPPAAPPPPPAISAFAEGYLPADVRTNIPLPVPSPLRQRTISTQ